MADAAHVTVQKAIVAALNAGAWSQTFTAARVLDPVTELPDLSELTVSVVPAEIGTDDLTRGKVQDTIRVDIGLQQKLAAGDYLPRADALAYLAQEIGDYFHRYKLPASVGLAGDCVGISTVPGAEPGHAPAMLRESRLFTAVVRTTWEVQRAKA